MIGRELPGGPKSETCRRGQHRKGRPGDLVPALRSHSSPWQVRLDGEECPQRRDERRPGARFIVGNVESIRPAGGACSATLFGARPLWQVTLVPHLHADDARSSLDRRRGREYIGSMKVKTSVTLSEDIMKSLGRAARRGESRSETIERLLREGLAARARQAADARDLALINRHAENLNAEAEDVLGYQVDL